MKPRTKIQKRIVSLSNQLYGNSPKGVEPLRDVKDWVENKLVEYPSCVTKSGIATCLNCMEKFQLEKGYRKKKAVCPCCGKEIKLTERRVQRVSDQFYFTILDTIEEFQVVQNYLCTANFDPKRGNSTIYIELDRIFIDKDQNVHAMSRRKSMNGDIAFFSDIEYRYTMFHPISLGVYPKSRILPFFRKRGFKASLIKPNNRLCVINLLSNLIGHSKVETLIKGGYIGIYTSNNRSSYTGDLSFDGYYIERYWPSIKIAIRNRYHAYDWGIWFDHLSMLRDEGKDLRNAHYVCPRNLKLEHQKAIDRERKRREKAEQERKIEQMLKDQKAEKEFIKRMKKFQDLLIKDNDISIIPLQDLEDFKQESDALKHCVFASKYYKRKDSLILSARVNSKRTETIEYNLQTKEVVQCRGLQNGSSPYHDKILEVFSKNVSQINKRI